MLKMPFQPRVGKFFSPSEDYVCRPQFSQTKCRVQNSPPLSEIQAFTGYVDNPRTRALAVSSCATIFFIFHSRIGGFSSFWLFGFRRVFGGAASPEMGTCIANSSPTWTKKPEILNRAAWTIGLGGEKIWKQGKPKEEHIPKGMRLSSLQ